MAFGFSLYTRPLQVAWIIYFGLELGDLESEKLLEDGKVCCY